MSRRAGLLTEISTGASDQLLWSQDFSSGVSPFSGGAQVAMSSAIGTSKPEYSHAIQGSVQPSSYPNWNTITSVNLSTITELSGKTLTKLEFYRAVRFTSTQTTYRELRYRITLNGVDIFNDAIGSAVFTPTDRAWGLTEVMNPVASSLVFQIGRNYSFGTNIPIGHFAVTGVKVYGH